MEDNRNRSSNPGAVREGSALLKGLLVCGKCGHRLLVSYGKTCRPRYSCQRACIDYGEPLCQSLAGRRLDELIARQVLNVLEPTGIELSLSAAADIQREKDELERHWQQRLERTRYDRERAERQYHVVEPENRLVARELEKRWEQTLREERTLQEDYDRFSRQQPAELTEADRATIRSLAQDVPRLWHSPHTTAADRQQIVRCLIERVVVTSHPESEWVDVAIHFAGGFVSHCELRRSVARYDQLRDYPQLLDRVQALAQQKLTAVQIAEALNGEGWRPPKRRDTFNKSMVQHLLWRRGLHGARPRSMSNDLLGQDEWWFTDLGRELDMPLPTLYRWLRRGWVHARQLSGPQGRWILWADSDELERLRRLRNCCRSWSNRPQAAELATPKPRTTPVEK